MPVKLRPKGSLWDHEFQYCVITEADSDLTYFQKGQIAIVEVTNGNTPREVGGAMAKPGKHNCKYELYDDLLGALNRVFEMQYMTDEEYVRWTKGGHEEGKEKP